MYNFDPCRCRECGNPPLGADTGLGAMFCSTKCRKSWHNRRMLRGAQIYDLFMAQRYERGAAKIVGAWKIMCRLAQMWREDDERAGRKSYFEPAEAAERQAITRATRVAWVR